MFLNCPNLGSITPVFIKVARTSKKFYNNNKFYYNKFFLKESSPNFSFVLGNVIVHNIAF